jgi:DNA invertase Pin-like site-specific DNA recombinase
MATSVRRAALYVRVSTSDKGQTVENQLQPLQEAAGRLGWSIVGVYATKESAVPEAATDGVDWMLC